MRYVRGTPDEGGLVLIDNSGSDGVEGAAADRADSIVAGQDAQNQDGANVLSPVGIALIVAGAVGSLRVALVARPSGSQDTCDFPSQTTPPTHFYPKGRRNPGNHIGAP